MVNKNTKEILINTLKISLASVLAILIAMLLNLQFAISAGIVAILSIQKSKRETIETAFIRLLGFVAALCIGLVCFQLFGFNIGSFCLYLVLFILTCQIFKWYSSIAMCSVLISHFVSLGDASLTSILNEVLIFIIGITFGILINLHLHKKTDEIENLKNKMDDKIVYTLKRMSERIINDKLPGYNGSCFIELEELLTDAKVLARENYQNDLKTKEDLDESYILMRESQIHVLYEMYKRCRNIKAKATTSQAISLFINRIADEYNRDNDCICLLNDFDNIMQEMKKAPLPISREEFENRAELYTLLGYIEEFLKIKRNHEYSKSLIH